MTARTLIKRVHGLALLVFLSSAVVLAQEPITAIVVQKGATVGLEYSILDEQGDVIETNKGGNQVSYLQGQGQLIPGVDRALAGMRVGERKTLTLKPEDAFGQIDPAALWIVPKTKIPGYLEGNIPTELLTVGAKFLGHAGRQVVPGRVREIRQDTVVVDVNHPLAGKTITVDIEIMNIIPPVQKSQAPAS